MIDDDDGRVTVLHKRHRAARKAHRCDECRRAIDPGERYVVERYVYEGDAASHKVCAHCDVVRDWLSAQCGGWMYGAIAEDIREHADEGAYGLGVMRAAVGIAQAWRRRDGRLWRVPNLADTPTRRRG